MASFRQRFENANKTELIYCGFAGGFGGAVGWLAVEPVVHSHFLGESETRPHILLYFLSSMLLWGFIGGLILAAEGSPRQLTGSVRRRFRLGFISAGGFSLISTFLSNRIFSGILTLGGVHFSQTGEMLSGSTAALVVARTLAWTTDGLVI